MTHRTFLYIPLVFAFISALPSPALGKRVVWHHGISPYRAVYRVARKPSHARAGYFLEVPVCGLGDVDGLNIIVYDARGRPLVGRALGRTLGNRALFVANGADVTPPLYAYWGSRMRTPQSRMGMVPGLTVDIRAVDRDAKTGTWRETQKLVKESLRLGIIPIDRIELARNPVDNSDAIIMDFNGFIDVRETAKWDIFLVNNEAGYVIIEGKLLIDQGAKGGSDRHGSGRVALPVRRGLIQVRCVVVDKSGPKMAVLARRKDERTKFTIPADAFVRSGQTTLDRVESKTADNPCPAFWVRHKSYIGIDNVVLTEVEMGSYSGASMEWTVGNGSIARGPTIARVLVGTAAVTVSAKAIRRRATATGDVTFAKIPKQFSWQNPEQYARYAGLINEQNLQDMDAPTLEGYYHLLTLKDRNPAAAAVAEVLFARSSTVVYSKKRTAYGIAFARAAARDQPKKARGAYLALIKANRKTAAKLITEIIEFELYRNHDLDNAGRELKRAVGLLGRDDLDVARLGGELALLRNNAAAAAAAFDRLRDVILASGESSRVTVRANALREIIRKEIKDGDVVAAEANMRRWIVSAPQAYQSGQYILTRTRLLRRMHWYAGGLALVDAFLSAHELPAYLPDLQLEKAYLLDALGRKNEARALYREIHTEFPRHPVAKEAERLLREK